MDKEMESGLDLRIGELMDLQRALAEAHPEWGGHHPEQGLRQMLWMVGELGEVIDVVKKASLERYMTATEVREHFVEEFCDVVMYLVDAMLCYGVTAEEFSAAYKKKSAYNLIRDYDAANSRKYGESKENTGEN